MPSVDLSEQDWQQIMTIIGDAPWKIAHPLLMKMGGQLHRQATASIPAGAGPPPDFKGIKLDANGKEVRDE